MYKTEDIVIYGSVGVCEIQGTTEKDFGGEKVTYYVVCPVNRKEEKIFVPTENEKALSKMRPILTKEQANELLMWANIPEGEWLFNDRQRQQFYKEMLLFGSSKEILKGMKTIYAQQKTLENIGKKLHAMDERFLKEAEKILMEELSYVLQITTEEAQAYICPVE